MSKFLDFFIEKDIDPYLEAVNAQDAGDFAKAAEIFTEMAADEFSKNLYSFARYCGLAAVAYLKANDSEKAEEQTNKALEAFHNNKNLSRSNFSPQYLLTIAWDMYEAGFIEEANLLTIQINQKLAENDCPISFDLEPPKSIEAECPYCQAIIKIILNKESKCHYCDSVISLK
ncbi:MAG TPA: tetratricopeptide repeat protein [Pyrinomonadaceae bacterium]|nr:tetratricopeptide repeat protein [Pyrinomonadaceae bacterium]